MFALHWGGVGRIVGATAAGVLISGFCIASLRAQGCIAPAQAADARELLRFGLPLVPHALAGALLASADRFAVSAQLGAGPLGGDGAATQLGLVIDVLADAATKAYTPSIYRMLSRNSCRERLRVVAIAYLQRASVAGGRLATVGTLSLLAGDMLVGGEHYRPAIDLSLSVPRRRRAHRRLSEHCRALLLHRQD